jgi:hypothetical protein
MPMRTRIFALLGLAMVGATMAADPPVVEPKELAIQLKAKDSKPVLLFVGFAVMFRKHIPGSTFIGPTSRAESLSALKAAIARLPHDGEVIIYCGCCPWDMCPNVKPAVELLKQMGFQHVKALMIPTNFARDWIDQGYPVEQVPSPGAKIP